MPFRWSFGRIDGESDANPGRCCYCSNRCPVCGYENLDQKFTPHPIPSLADRRIIPSDWRQSETPVRSLATEDERIQFMNLHDGKERRVGLLWPNALKWEACWTRHPRPRWCVVGAGGMITAIRWQHGMEHGHGVFRDSINRFMCFYSRRCLVISVIRRALPGKNSSPRFCHFFSLSLKTSYRVWADDSLSALVGLVLRCSLVIAGHYAGIRSGIRGSVWVLLSVSIERESIKSDQSSRCDVRKV